MPTIHVVPHDDGWAVKHEGEDEPISTHGTQGEAEAAAKTHARGHGDPEVVIHGRDGRIRDSDTMDRAHEGAGRDTVR
ncbi:MAG TPA: DUF2188 domain-containing protein [Conexibacter sp.]|nr:DUF2188 domain-containing protein [Conexibacter sp.]